MYEFNPHANPMGLGVWGWVAPAVGVPAAAYALYQARRRQQAQAGQSQAVGTIEPALARSCRENSGAPCSPQQISDLCWNMSYNTLIENHWNECRPHVTAAHMCRLSDGQACSSQELGEWCAIRSSGQRPRDCAPYVAALEVQQQGVAEVQRLQPYLGAKTEHQTGVVTGGGMQGLGWSRVDGRSPCSAVPNGEQFCFRSTTVGENPPEDRFARNQGCLPVSSGARCETSPYANPGTQWCCPPGWPREPGSAHLQAGEFPPSPPGIGNKVAFWGQYWWFWVIVTGVPVAGYLGYRYLQDREGAEEASDWDDAYDIEDVQVGAY